MRQHAVAVIVALDDQLGVIVFNGECGDAAREILRRKVSAKLGALQAGCAIDDLRAGIIAFGATAGGIYADDVLARSRRWIPDAKRAVFALLAILLGGKFQPLFDDFQIEDAFAGGTEPTGGIFAKVLRRQPAETGLQIAAVSDLPGRKPMALRQLDLFGSERMRIRIELIDRLVPPGKEVTRVSGFGGPLPFVVKAAGSAIGRGLQNNLAVRRHSSAQRSQSSGSVARPAGDLRAMQVLDGQPAAGVGVGGGGHAVFAVEFRKHDLANIGARSPQRAQAQPFRQILQEAMHNLENLFRRLLIVRHLHGQRAGMRDGAQKKARRHPGSDAKLTGFQNDLARAAVASKLDLSAIQGEGRQRAGAIADAQQAFHQMFLIGAAAQAERASVELLAEQDEKVEVGSHASG